MLLAAKVFCLISVVIVAGAQKGRRGGRRASISAECLTGGTVCTDAAACVFNVGSMCAKSLLDFDETAKALDQKLRSLNHEEFQWDKERFLKRHEIMESEFVRCLETYIGKKDLEQLGKMCPTTASRKKREVDLTHIREKRRSKGKKSQKDFVKPDVEYLPESNSMRQIYDIKAELGKLDQHLWSVCNYSSCMDAYKDTCISSISSRTVDAWNYCTKNMGDIVEVMRDIEMEEEVTKSCHTGQMCNQTQQCISDVEGACSNAALTLKADFDSVNEELKALGHPGRSWAPDEWETIIEKAESSFKSCLSKKLSRKETEIINQSCPDVLSSGGRRKRSISSSHFTYLHRVKRRARKNKKSGAQNDAAVTHQVQALLDNLDDIESQMGDACCDYACWVPFKETCVPLVSSGAVKDWNNCEDELDEKLQVLLKE